MRLHAKAPDLAYNLYACLLVLIIAALSVNAFAPQRLTADAILISIISLKNVTLFYWGQDRYTNLIPWLLSAVDNRNINLLACLFSFALAYYALLWILCRLILTRVLQRSSWLEQNLLFLLFAAISLLLMKELPSYAFIVEGQPYALSLLCVFLAIELATGPRTSPARYGFAALLIFAGTGLNPSVFLVTMAVYFVLLVNRRAKPFHLLALWQVLAFFAWGTAGKQQVGASATNYSELRLDGIFHKTTVAGLAVWDSFHTQILLVILGVTAFLLILSRNKADLRRSVPLLVWSLLFAAGWLVLMSGVAWVQVNHYAFRYFFPVIFIMIGGLAYLLYLSARLLTSRYKLFFSAVLVLLIGRILVKPLVSIDDYAVFSATKPYSQYARDQRIAFISGDYWRVWPTVFTLHEDAMSPLGVAYRSDGEQPLVPEVLNVAARNAPTRAMCIGTSLEECASMLQANTGNSWLAANESCGQDCSLMQKQ